MIEFVRLGRTGENKMSKYNKDFYMDDVGSIALKVIDLIQEELAKHNIKLDDKEEDLFYVPIFNALENFSNGEYRGYN